MQSIMKDQFSKYDPEFTKKADVEASKARTTEVPLKDVHGVPIHMFVGQ